MPRLVLPALSPLAEARRTHVDLLTSLRSTLDPDRMGLFNSKKGGRVVRERSPTEGERELGSPKVRGTYDVLMAPVAVICCGFRPEEQQMTMIAGEERRRKGQYDEF